MTPRKILVLDGHPAHSSLSSGFARAYADAARDAGHEVRLHSLSEMSFDPDFGQSTYKDCKPLEPDIAAFAEDLEWAGHVVIATPLWWGGLPARLKGLFDRVLLPGRAFDTRSTTLLGQPKPMLTGRSARVLVTSDTPGWFQRIVYGGALQRQLRAQILGYVGIRPARFSWFAPASHASGATVTAWLARISELGRKAA